MAGLFDDIPELQETTVPPKAVDLFSGIPELQETPKAVDLFSGIPELQETQQTDPLEDLPESLPITTTVPHRTIPSVSTPSYDYLTRPRQTYTKRTLDTDPDATVEKFMATLTPEQQAYIYQTLSETGRKASEIYDKYGERGIEEISKQEEAAGPHWSETLTQPAFDAVQVGIHPIAGGAREYQRTDSLLKTFKRSASEFLNAMPGIDEELAEKVAGAKPQRSTFFDYFKDMEEIYGSLTIPLAGGIPTGVRGADIDKILGRSLGMGVSTAQNLARSVADPSLPLKALMGSKPAEEKIKWKPIELPENTTLAILGLVGDIILDPLTYYTGGISAGIKMGVTGIRAIPGFAKAVKAVAPIGKATAKATAKVVDPVRELVGGKYADLKQSIPRWTEVEDISLEGYQWPEGVKAMKEFPLPKPVEKDIEEYITLRTRSGNVLREKQYELKARILELAAGMTLPQRLVVGEYLSQPKYLPEMLTQVARDPEELEDLLKIAEEFRYLWDQIGMDVADAGMFDPVQLRWHHSYKPEDIRPGTSGTPVGRDIKKAPEGLGYTPGLVPVTKPGEKASLARMEDMGVTPKTMDQMIAARSSQGHPGFLRPKVFQNPTERLQAGYPTELDIAMQAAVQGNKELQWAMTKTFIDDVIGNPNISTRIEKGHLASLKNNDEFKAALDEKGYAIFKPDYKTLTDEGKLVDAEVAYVVPKEINNHLTFANDIFSGKADDLNAARKLFEGIKKGTSIWRGYAVLSPGFHMRNMFGNYFNNWLGDVTNPQVYADAFHIQTVGRGGDFGDVVAGSLKGEEILKEAIELGVYNRGMFADLIPENLQKELLRGLSKGGSQENLLRRVFGQEGSLLKANRWVGSQIENNARLAHFMDKLRKGASPEDAALSVKKYLFDYEDLSGFEREVLKTASPFYTWMRKNIPLQISTLLNKPGKYAKIPKALQTLEHLGPEETGVITPDYFENIDARRTPFQYEGKRIYWHPNLPYGDLNRFNYKDIIASLHPILKLAFEVSPDRGHSIFLDRPILRYPGEADPQLPFLGGKQAHVARTLLPTLGKITRGMRSHERGELPIQFLSELGGLKLYPLDPGRELMRVSRKNRDILRAAYEALGLRQKGEKEKTVIPQEVWNVADLEKLIEMLREQATQQ